MTVKTVSFYSPYILKFIFRFVIMQHSHTALWEQFAFKQPYLEYFSPKPRVNQPWRPCMDDMKKDQGIALLENSNGREADTNKNDLKV